ncbi:hypothetical protein [Curtobacterium sp. 9128]|uniref:hypothetical protein n=1 Tax=Curtobacterium sp. 9128 TaxID=1793722 RepID=UPI0011A4F1F8|nr:hypothetical protein [Curtobacterium sp. 9128]
MSMSTPFDPEQQGSDVPVDGSDADELAVEEGRADQDRADLTGSAEVSDADASPARQHDEDEAGGGPVFRRPQAGDRLDAEELTADSELDS